MRECQAVVAGIPLPLPLLCHCSPQRCCRRRCCGDTSTGAPHWSGERREAIPTLSDTILLGSPWGLMTCQRKWSARSSGFMVPWQATKCPIFLRRSIITHNASFPLLVDSAVIKSIDIVFNGWCGSSSGFSSPNGACRIGLMRWQVSQWLTYLWMYFRCPGQ